MSATFDQIALDFLIPSPTNPRKKFGGKDWPQMVESVRQRGVMQPLLVRPWPADRAGGTPDCYEIVAGERRYRASREAERAEVPCMIRNLSDHEVLEMQVIENLQREDLTELEEADGYRLMIDAHGYTADTLAEKIGKSRSYIYGRLSLTKLSQKARDLVEGGSIDASTATLIARIPGEQLQTKAMAEITRTDYHGEPMSFRRAQQYVQDRFMLKLSEAPFPIKDETLLAGAGKCGTCPKKTGNARDLFPDVKSPDVCTDPDCFGQKKAAWVAQQAEEAQAKGLAVITGKAAEKVMPHGMHSDFKTLVPLDKTNYDASPGKSGYPTFRDQLKDAQIPLTLVEHDGALVECVERGALNAALQAAGLGSTRQSQSERDKAQQQKLARETDFRRTLYGSLRDQIRAQLTAGKQPTHADMAMITDAAFYRADHETQKRIAAMWISDDDAKGKDGKLDHHARIRSLRSIIPDMSADELAILMFDTALVGQLTCSTWGPTTTPEELLETAVRWGVDVNGIKKQCTANAKEKGRAKAAKSKPTPPAETAALAQNTTPAQGQQTQQTTASPVADWPFPAAPDGAPTEPAAQAQATTAEPEQDQEQAASAARKPKAKASKDSGSAAGGKKKTTPAHPPIAYRNANGQTWTGRGKKPAWVEAHLASGGTLEDLRVVERCEKTVDMLEGV